MDSREITGMIKRPMTRKRNILRARNYVFTAEEMKLFQIQGVFNSVSRTEDMTHDYVNQFVQMHARSEWGEIALTEKGFYGDERSMCVLSVVVFASLWGMQLYMIRFKEEYMSTADDKSLMGMFN